MFSCVAGWAYICMFMAGANSIFTGDKLLTTPNPGEDRDAALAEMSQRRPRNAPEFLDINGVGRVKLERHGETFLRAMRALG